MRSTRHAGETTSPRDEAGAPPSARQVRFAATGDARHPYAAVVDGQRWVVRVEEFPEAPCVYTLFVDGAPAEELMEWPPGWRTPER